MEPRQLELKERKRLHSQSELHRHIEKLKTCVMKFLSRLRLRMHNPTTRLGQSMCLLAGERLFRHLLFRALTVQAQKRNLMSLSPSFFFAALCPVPTASMCPGVLGKTCAARRLERSRQTAAHSVPDHFLKENLTSRSSAALTRIRAILNARQAGKFCARLKKWRVPPRCSPAVVLPEQRQWHRRRNQTTRRSFATTEPRIRALPAPRSFSDVPKRMGR